MKFPSFCHHRKQFSAKWLLFQCFAKMAATRIRSRIMAIANVNSFPPTFQSLYMISYTVFSLCRCSDFWDEQTEGRPYQNELRLGNCFVNYHDYKLEGEGFCWDWGVPRTQGEIGVLAELTRQVYIDLNRRYATHMQSRSFVSFR